MAGPDIRMGVFTIPVQTYRHEATENKNAEGKVISQSFRSVPAKLVQVEVRVEVDMTALALSLGRAAYFNKGKLAKEAGGLVVVRVLRETDGDPVEVKPIN